jgi:long-chain fatty acid transport protein
LRSRNAPGGIHAGHLSLPAGLLLLCAGIALPGAARAAGFALFEQGAAAMGRGGAFVASASDASALFYNPAGLAGLAGTRVLLSPSLILFDDSFAGTAPYPGYGVASHTATRAFPLPAFYVSHEMGPRSTLAAGVTAPFGLETDWTRDPAFAGRFLATRSRVQQIDASLGAGVSASGSLQLGAAANLSFSKILLRRALGLPAPGTDQVLEVGTLQLESPQRAALGASAGIRWLPGRRLALGAAVRSGSSADFTLPAQFSYSSFSTGSRTEDSLLQTILPRDQDATARVRFPMILLAGVEWRPSESVRTELDVNWTRWSVFDTLALAFTADPQLSQKFAQDFGNSVAVRAGLEWEGNPWTLRAGAYWDGTPQPAATLSPLISDTSRLGFSAGVGRALGAVRLDAYALLVVFHDRSTEQSNPEHLDGSYRPRGAVLGLSLGWAR